MKSNKKGIVLEFKLPEFSEKDIKVSISKNKASVEAEKKQEKKIQRKDFYHRESTYRSFSYSTTLPKINPKKAEISFKKGTLKITAPRA